MTRGSRVAVKNVLKELEEKTAEALAMGGTEKLAERKAQGVLNARERIDCLVDAAASRSRGAMPAASAPRSDTRRQQTAR